MALPQEVRASFRSLVETGNVRYIVLPGAAAGAAVANGVGDAAWDWAAAATSQTISADCGGLDPCWLAGFTVVQSAFILATTYADLRLGIGALAAEVWLGTFPILTGIETAVGLAAKTPVWLPWPIRITGDPRICAQIRNSVGGVAEGITVKVILASAVGT